MGLEFIFMELVKFQMNNIMKKRISFIILTFLIYSCGNVNQESSIDLGSNYRYIPENPKAIIYNTDKKFKDNGVNIVPPIVLSYDFNDYYIIAKSQEVNEMTGDKEGKPTRYWIIDKSLKGSPVNPMDSLTFYQTLKKENITLSLENDR